MEAESPVELWMRHGVRDAVHVPDGLGLEIPGSPLFGLGSLGMMPAGLDDAGLSGVSPFPAAPATALQQADVLASYTTGRDPGLFNIEVDFQGGWTPDLQQAFTHAVQVVEGIIRADLPDVVVPGAAGFMVVDDLVISAGLANIDGVGGLLGEGGPTVVRVASGLPVLGAMTFDIADAQALEGSVAVAHAGPGGRDLTLWDATVLHEMLHVLGFGSLWAQKGLVAGDAYVGPAGELAYAQLRDPAAATGQPVPVETTGGPGTAGVHWSEAVFGSELMTGYLDHGTTPLSLLTAASLADLGYGLDPAAGSRVDPYLLA